jgi:hypothetical protein
VAALVHIAGVVVIAVNSIRQAGGGARNNRVEEPPPEETAGTKVEAEQFRRPTFTPLAPV